MQHLPTTLACLLSTALVAGCMEATRDVASQEENVPPAAAPGLGWSGSFHPKGFRGDAAFRLDIAFHDYGRCEFRFVASGKWTDAPVQMLALKWTEEEEGNVGMSSSLTVARGTALHTGVDEDVFLPGPGGWSASGSARTDGDNTSAHWIFYGKDLEPVGRTDGLKLDASCEGDVGVDFVGGGRELFGFAPGNFAEGTGAGVAEGGALAFVSTERSSVTVTQPAAVFAAANLPLAGTGEVILEAPDGTHTWAFADPTVPLFVGPAGDHAVALTGAGADNLPVLVLFGATPIRTMEEAATGAA